MLALKRVAITGSIASGKSTVLSLFKELGAYILSADEIVHELLVPESPIGKKIVSLLGQEIVKNGTFDRKEMANLVFRDMHLLGLLEEIIHPEVQRNIEARYQELSIKNERFSLFVCEIPLLYESKMESGFDAVIVVYADREESLKRSKISKNEYERRTKRLMPLEEKIKKADFIINNSSSIENLKQNVKQIFNQLK